MYNFDMQKIMQFEPRPALKFWNPGLDFVGVILCLGEIRHITKTVNMKSDVDVVDVRILQGKETVEETYEEMGREKTKTYEKQYEAEERTMTLANLCCTLPYQILHLFLERRFSLQARGKNQARISSMTTISCLKSLRQDRQAC
ncbi:MAG: hypothetical protein WBF38_03970 [Nitrosotalea sp.]